MSLAPFESFHLELAKMVNGDPHAREPLGFIQRDTTMLLFDGLDTYHFWLIFREFLVPARVWLMLLCLSGTAESGPLRNPSFEVIDSFFSFTGSHEISDFMGACC